MPFQIELLSDSEWLIGHLFLLLPELKGLSSFPVLGWIRCCEILHFSSGCTFFDGGKISKTVYTQSYIYIFYNE